MAHGHGTFVLHLADQALHLALAEAEQFGRRRRAQAAVQELCQHLDALELAVAHQNQSHVEALMPRGQAQRRPSGQRRQINFASSRQF